MFLTFFKGRKHLFRAKKRRKTILLPECCLNVVSMLSQCCLQRQHSDNIFEKLFFVENLGYVCNSRPKLSECCSGDNIQTTLRQHNICKKKLLWTILDMFATRSQSCLNVVSRDNIQTTFREHSNNIGTKHFLKNLGHVCNSQPTLLDGPVLSQIVLLISTCHQNQHAF